MKVFMAVFLGLAMLVPGSASAHTTSLSVYNNYFSPQPGALEPGHDVTWTWGCPGYGNENCATTHNVTAYAGASFSSGNLTRPASFTATMPTTATAVSYRCTLHSTLVGSTCSGMCGLLSLDTQRPSGSVTNPTADQVFIGAPTVAVSFAGTAEDNAGIASATLRLYDLLGAAKDYATTCSGGCGTTSQTWAATVALAPGQYLAEVKVIDSVGNSTTSVPRRRFFVL